MSERDRRDRRLCLHAFETQKRLRDRRQAVGVAVTRFVFPRKATAMLAAAVSPRRLGIKLNDTRYIIPHGGYARSLREFLMLA